MNARAGDAQAGAGAGATAGSVDASAAHGDAQLAAARNLNEPLNVLIVGVGGQGVILVSKVLAWLAQSHGFEVKQSEVHGMAKRGGSVFSHVRFGERVCRRRSPRARPTSWSRWSGPRGCAGCPT